MKYLIYAKASQELEKKLDQYREMLGTNVVKVPSAGTHCTIMNFYSIMEREHDIVAALMRISNKLDPIKMRCTNVAPFDENMMVVKLDKNHEMDNVHEQIVYTMQQFIDWRKTPQIPAQYANDPLRCAVYKKCGSPYFLACYNPHITIANTKTDFVQIGNFFEGTEWLVKELHLARKELDGWHDVATIHLRQ